MTLLGHILDAARPWQMPSEQFGSNRRFIVEFPGIRVYKVDVRGMRNVIVVSTRKSWQTILWCDDPDTEIACREAPRGAEQFRAYIAMQGLPSKDGR